ncbi:MAG: glycoside hydrolase family 127 protein [Kiritimatiellae bacterium]|nr:glycoside hydrolase family 127 protein [Kiritimatiellia bacterium]
MMGVIWIVCAVSLAIGDSDALKPCRTDAIRPSGHISEFLRRQVTGTTGRHREIGYPFDGCMWSGIISNVYFEEDLPYSRRITAPRNEIWWPYEQTAYMLDGMVRLSQLVDAPELKSEFKRNLDFCIEHQAEDGDLFKVYSKSSCQWPVVVFFRAALAYIDETGDERAEAAFIRHYAGKREAPQNIDDRDVLNVEGMLKVAEWTGDRSYVGAAEDWFRRHIYFEKFAHESRVHSHGVTFAEMLKLPALLYKATGKKEWKALAQKAMRDVFAANETPNGQVSACEYLSGRDPWEGSETCVAADMLCSLGHFVEIFADCEAADHMERIAYNALPGAMTKDFTAHQYISLPNQAVATPFSHGSHFFYGEPDWNRYRVCHFAQCCSGNINRAMPLFVQRMWLKRTDGAPVAMLHGPSSVSGEFGGVKYTITCETDYPFGDRLIYRFKVNDGGRARGTRAPAEIDMPFSFRVPSWARSVSMKKNGVLIDDRSGSPLPTALAAIGGPWHDGDILEVVFDQPVTLESDRHWHWLRRGALTLAHPVKTQCVREKTNAEFRDLSFEDPAPFNFAFDIDEIAKTNLVAEAVASVYPFEQPNLLVHVPMREVAEWQTLSEQRFTPPVPLFTHPTGRRTVVDFVPYATTLTRITAFPDTAKRTPLPVVRAYASPECYDYDPKKPLPEQIAEPESWSDEEFCDKGVPIQRSPDLWSDLEAQYLANKGKFAYVLLRFWSDRAGRVTCALGASRCVQAFFDGKDVYSKGPIVEGRMVAPFWFELDAKKGYNFLKVKVATNGKEKVFGQDQYRREWGVRLDVFREEYRAGPVSGR